MKRLKEEKKEEASIALLRCWVHPKRQVEASYQNIHKLVSLSEEEAIGILDEYTRPKRYIRGTQGKQLDIDLTITTLDTNQTFSVTALVDSGCTGSAIDATFVKEKGINTKKLLTPIPSLFKVSIIKISK